MTGHASAHQNTQLLTVIVKPITSSGSLCLSPLCQKANTLQPVSAQMNVDSQDSIHTDPQQAERRLQKQLCLHHPSSGTGGDQNSLFLSFHSQDWKGICRVQWGRRQSQRLWQPRGIPSTQAKGAGRFVHSSAYTAAACSSQWQQGNIRAASSQHSEMNNRQIRAFLAYTASRHSAQVFHSFHFKNWL